MKNFLRGEAGWGGGERVVENMGKEEDKLRKKKVKKMPVEDNNGRCSSRRANGSILNGQRRDEKSFLNSRLNQRIGGRRHVDARRNLPHSHHVCGACYIDNQSHVDETSMIRT